MGRHKYEMAAPSSPEALKTARQARQHSEQRLEEVQSNWPAVKSITASLRDIRTENHFAERYRGAHE